MKLKALALCAVAILSISALAQTKTYTVKEGDTLSEIAEKLGVSERALASANPNVRAENLQIGAKLTIPGRSSSGGGSVYVVQNRDNDYVIARKFGLTVSQLHALNPGVNWRNLQIGDKINVSRSRAASQSAASRTGATHTVVSGDNDVKIARRYGITVDRLHQLNPGVNWRRIQPGDKIKISAAPAPAPRPVTTAPRPAPQPRPQPVSGVLRGEPAPQPISYTPIGTTDAVVNADRVNVRREAWSTSARVASVRKGRVVTIQKRNEEWLRVQFIPGGTVGWVKLEVTERVDPTTTRIVAENVPVRNAPFDRSETLVTVAKGREAKVVGKNNPWYHVRFDGGTQGWIRADLLDPVSPEMAANLREEAEKAAVVAQNSSRVDSLLDTAHGFMGVRYRYGGTSRSGFDCSGFVYTVFAQHGIRLPRTSIEQSRVGQRVERGDLRRGDLVFFVTRGRRVSHVGIYIGNNQFIHASSGGGRVEIDSISGYYANRYAGARRVGDFSVVAPELPEPVVARKPSEEPAVRTPARPVQTNMGADPVVR